MKRRFAHGAFGKLTLTALCALSMIACSSFMEREDDQETLQRYLRYVGPPVDRFTRLAGFTGWRALDRDKIVVWTGINEAYLLRIGRPCEDPRFASTIGVTSTGSSVSLFESVIIGDDKCRILEIRPLDYRQLKEDMREEKKAG